jgi:hypothetical protein
MGLEDNRGFRVTLFLPLVGRRDFAAGRFERVSGPLAQLVEQLTLNQ